MEDITSQLATTLAQGSIVAILLYSDGIKVTLWEEKELLPALAGSE